MSDSPDSAGPVHDPYAALRLPNYRHYLAGSAIALIGGQMFSLAISWELYQRTHSATALGLVGLFQIIPILLLALPAGHLVDRFNRKTIILIDQFLLALSAAALGTASLFADRIPDLPILHTANAAMASLAVFFHERPEKIHFTDRHLPVLYALLFLNGIIRSINQPAKQSLMPQLVPPQAFPNAVTWNSSLFEICTMIGPTLAGFLLAFTQRSNANSPWSYASIYYLNAGAQFAQLLIFLPITLQPMARAREPVTLRSLLAGIRFVWQTKMVIATITLDMFGVLLGGATALLPMFARDILHVGPVGLGWLRAAPSIGAFSMAMLLAHLPPMKRAGRNLLLAVGCYGVATVGFGATALVPVRVAPTVGFALAILCLFLTGLFDNISVVVRHSLIQILTPDQMRGRVSAVNSVFPRPTNSGRWSRG